MQARDSALDGLRGIAILLVMSTHLLRLEPTQPLWLWTNAVLRSGWIGVDLFFVLSGFLITRILIESRSDPLRARNFYARRALRILPAYYVYLALTLLVIYTLVPTQALVDDTSRHLPGLLIFAQNLGSAALGEPSVRELRHLWSLAVEEQFYLVWPWLLWAIKPASVASFCLRLLALSWACKLALWAADAEALTIYYFTLCRLDGFAVGGFLAARVCAEQLRLPMLYRLASLLAVLVMVGVFLMERGLSTRLNPALAVLLSSATPLLFAGVLYQTLCRRPNQWLRLGLQNRALLFFGRYSYGLYLVHFAADTWVRICLQPWLERSLAGNSLKVVVATCSVAVAVIFALLLHRLIEAPALALKKKFEPTHSHAQASAASLAIDTANSTATRHP